MACSASRVNEREEEGRMGLNLDGRLWGGVVEGREEQREEVIKLEGRGYQNSEGKCEELFQVFLP